MQKRDLGQIWTPTNTVNHILDLANYTGTNTLTRTILEPGFGAGAFLLKIVERIITAGQEKGLTVEAIAHTIDTNVHGVEIDIDTYNKTFKKVQEYCKTHNIDVVLPNLKNMDALDYEKTINRTFDYVIGNPPYIRIHDIPETMRQKIKQYPTSTGTTDLYIIFYEIGLKLLKTNGTLIYIAPNSWGKNTSQKGFRKFLFDNHYVTYIEDYGSQQVFDNASTYVSIVKLQKITQNTFTIRNVESNTQREFKYTDIKDTTASLAALYDESTGTPLGSLCAVQNGVATLKDKIYLSDTDYNLSKFVKPCVKASTYKGEPIDSYIIFPYVEDNGKLRGATELEIQEDMSIYNHLLDNKDILTARSIDNNSLWFWYGRSQALKKTGHRKLVISPLVSPTQTSVNCYQVPAGTVVYSGIFICELDSNGLSLDMVESVLKSDAFIAHCRLFGKNMRGGYHAVSAPVIKNFLISNDALMNL